MSTSTKRSSLARTVLAEWELQDALDLAELELQRAGRELDRWYADLENAIARERRELLAAVEREAYPRHDDPDVAR